MRSILLALLLSSALAAGSVPSVRERSRAQAQESALRKLDSLWARMYATHDTVAASKLYDDGLDFRTANGATKTKAQEMSDVRPAAGLVMEYFRTTPESVVVRADSGFVSGAATWRFTLNGAPREVRRTYSATYVRGGPLGWRIVAIRMGNAPAGGAQPTSPSHNGASQDGMFRNGPQHLGVYESGSPSLSTVVWKFKTAGRVISSPLVVGEVVYVGSTDNSLYAINRGDGTRKWKFDTRGSVNSSPAFSNGVVYASSLDGKLYAVDAATGKEKWSFATKGERRFTAPGIHGAMPRTELMPDPFDVFLSSPTVAGGVVYVGSGDTHMYAIDTATGALRWSFKTGDVVHASPAVSDGTVYIGSWDSYMYALDAATGKQRWRFKTGIDTAIYNQVGIASSAAVDRGVVYFGCRDGHFYAVDARTGEMKWKHDNKMGWTIASPAVRNGTVYFPTSDGTRFKALDTAGGAVKFSIVNKAVSFSSPAIAGNVAYYGTSDGWLHAVDIGTGAMIAEFQTDGSKANAARYTDSTGRMNTGLMYPDRTIDGMMIGMRTMMTLGSVLSSPAIAGGVLYVGSTDGNVYALR